MELLTVILLLVGAVSFGLAAFGVPGRVNWIGLGLLAWILVPLLGALSRL